MRRKPNLAARMQRCEHLLIKVPEMLRGRWLEEYNFREMRLEPGCGKGKFTVETAGAEPDVLFVALEKSADAIITALERAVADGLKNTLFINALADNLTEYFAPGEVSRIYINFCDPWPANRHARRRLTCGRFLELYRQALRPDGEIRFKTDNLPLFEFSLTEFAKNGFELVEETRDLHKGEPVGVMTDYESKFHSLGLPIYQCVVRL